MANLWLMLKNQFAKERRRSPFSFWFWLVAFPILCALYGLSRGCSR